jgi:CRISPR/Cas system CSM-associated protein Csm3 (group 7 of RAMP superfamily)
MANNKPFLLIKGELIQQTAASLGGNGESDWVDHVLCRDGLRRCTLRGETLAGALLATARKVNPTPPQVISGKSSKMPSVWRLFTSHPVAEPISEVRQNVRIHAQTGAAADGALFDAETLPPGTRWPFLLEIDMAAADESAEAVLKTTLQALALWEKGYCWLGRAVARGTGWFKLENAVVAEADWDHWPNSGIDDLESYFMTTFNGRARSLEQYWFEKRLSAIVQSDWHYIEYQLTLTVGAPPADDYGIDFLAVGGHAGDALLLDVQEDLIARQRLLLPQAGLSERVTQHWLADQVFAYTRANGQMKPYIPGSSIRGVLRHAAEWWAHKHGLDVQPLTQLFGAMTDKPLAGKLLVSDAHLTHDVWQAALLKMHSEDEFAGGVYENALFDRLVLTQAQFGARLVIEAKRDEIEALNTALQPVIELARQGFIGLGGQAWRGFGHLHWQITPVSTEKISHEH